MKSQMKFGKRFYCVKGCEGDPEIFYPTKEDCQNDCGDPKAVIVPVYVLTEDEYEAALNHMRY